MGRRSGRRRHGDARLRVIHGEGQPKRGTTLVDDAMQPLMVDLRRGLRADDPWPLLEWVSAMIVAAQAPRQSGDEPLGLAPLVESFIGVDLAETTAALSVLAVLLDDADMVTDIEQELAHRTQPMPLWLRGLRETRVLDARLIDMPDARGQDLLLGVDWAGGGTGTYVVYIDHGRGTVVSDAFPTPVSIDVVVGQLRTIDDPIARGFGFESEQLELADARALVGEALDATTEAHHDPESETWPAGRPLLDWLLQTLPDGGVGWATRERAPFDDEDDAYDLGDLGDLDDSDDMVERFVDAMLAPVDHLVDEFAASDIARSAGVDVLDDAADRAALALVCASGDRQSDKAMLAWTPDRVEDLLLGTLPRSYLVGDRVGRRVPTVVASFARWCLERTGARKDQTAHVQDAVERCRSAYLALVSSPEATRLRLAVQDYAHLLGDPFGMVPVIDTHDDSDWSEYVLDHLAESVGGRDALLVLDTAPLPDEDLDWTTVPEDVREPVAEVLGLLDRIAAEHFDVELRTAQRRFLSAVVAGEPDIFRRRGSTASAAAVIAWLVGRANGVIASGGSSMPAGDLWPYFGLKSGASQRGPTFRRAAGLEAYGLTTTLGRPEWLTSAARRQITERRDLVQSRRPV